METRTSEKLKKSTNLESAANPAGIVRATVEFTRQIGETISKVSDSIAAFIFGKK